MSIWASLALATAGILLFLIFIALMADMHDHLQSRGRVKMRCSWCGKCRPVADMQYSGGETDLWACPRCR